MASITQINVNPLPAWSIGPVSKPSTVAVAPRSLPSPVSESATQRTRPATNSAARLAPCPTCSSLIAWLDAYGAAHCAACDPIPFLRLSFCRSVVAVAPTWWLDRVRNLSLALPGFPASQPVRATPASQGRDEGGEAIKSGGRSAPGEARDDESDDEAAAYELITLDVPKDIAGSLVLFVGEEGDELFDLTIDRWYGLWVRRWRRVPIVGGEPGTKNEIAVGKILERDGTVSDVVPSRVGMIFERWK